MLSMSPTVPPIFDEHDLDVARRDADRVLDSRW